MINPQAINVVATINNEVVSNNTTEIPRINDRLTEELVFALVGPVGSGCSTAADLLNEVLADSYKYEVHYYKLSDYIMQEASLVSKDSLQENGAEADRIEYLQNIGDLLRKECGQSYLAAKAIEDIASKREIHGFGKTVTGQFVPKKLRHVHIIDSIKHPEELKLLRDTYREIFWLIGVFAPYSIREQRLSTAQPSISKKLISRITDRDYLEDEDHGQKVRDVFYLADFFVRNDQQNKIQLKKTIERFVDVLFGSPVHTPNIHESTMYAAYAEAAKSACLSRQVGASILSQGGELIGLGRNDVPRFGGGLYTEDNGESDHRCHAWGERACHNDKKKEVLYEQIFYRLQKSGLLASSASLEQITKELKSTDVKSLIEYSRAVHAEMDAITSVARTHKAGLLGGTLYSTTFPCHSCARHIVASGINKVFFIEPYPKSLAMELHSDAVSENEGDEGKKVLFLQYSGIAPKNILKLFNAGLTRKDSNGKLRAFDKKDATPVVAVSLDDYATHEKWVIAELEQNEKKLREKQTSLPGI